MYIYHALINALSAHTIHINLNTMFYTHVARARTHARTHTHTHTDCSTNWVLILAGAEILSEEQGFQFGLKR